MMKTFRKLIPFAALALMCAAAGCNKESDTHYQYVNVPLESHDVVLSEEDVFDVGIGIASASYRVESADPAVVTAELVDGVIRLTAHAIGKTMVSLADEGYNRARMQVEVKKLYELTLEAIPGGQEVLRLDNDATPKELKILTGNGGYTALSSDPEAVEAQVVADETVMGGYKLVLTGHENANDVVVTVTDAKRKSATVAVRVTNPIRPVTFDVEGPLTGEYRYNDTPAELTFNITSGNGGYTVASSNESVVTAALSGTTVTLTVVGDGGATITVTDQEKESRSIGLGVPMNPEDPTPRVSWDGYRADLSVAGTSLREGWATTKHMYWDQATAAGTDTYHVAFNGGWADGLECVKASNRLPLLETSVGGITTLYNDKTSAIPLESLKLVKQINATPTPAANPRIYWITFKAAGKEGFIVFAWKY